MAELRGPVRSMGRQIRAHQWWNHRVPIVLATAYTVLAVGSDVSAPRLILDVALFLVAVIGVAGFGHVVNDVFDRESDAAGGKDNTTKSLSSGAIAALIAGLLAVSIVPWIWLPHPRSALVLLACELLLLLAYAAPPIRLKDRGLAGVIADALYGLALPVALTYATFSAVATEPLSGAVQITALVWAAATGIRGILVHQIEDIDADRAGGTATLAGRLGRERTVKIVAAVLPVDAVALVVLMVELRSVIPSAPWVLVGFVAYRAFQVRYLWTERLPAGWFRSSETRSQVVGFVFLNEFAAYWYPLAAGATLVHGRPTLAPLLVAHVLLFRSALYDLWSAAKLAARWGHEQMRFNPARRAIAPLIGVAYVGLALTPSHLDLLDIVVGVVAIGLALHLLAATGRAVAARTFVAQPGFARLTTETAGRVWLPAVVGGAAILLVPGVGAAGWVVVAVIWVALTSLRGVLSRPLSEAWVLDTLPEAARDAAEVDGRRALVTRVLVPLDLLVLLAVLASLTRVAPETVALIVVFLPWCIVATLHYRGGQWATVGDTRTKTIHRPVVAIVGEYSEHWFAFAALVAAVVVHPGLWPLVPAHILLVGGPVDLLIAPELRKRYAGPLSYVAPIERQPQQA